MFDFIYHMTLLLKTCILTRRHQYFANDLNRETELKSKRSKITKATPPN